MRHIEALDMDYGTDYGTTPIMAEIVEESEETQPLSDIEFEGNIADSFVGSFLPEEIIEFDAFVNQDLQDFVEL